MIMKLTAIKQSELYKHINIDESKARQRGAVRSVEEEEANQEGDHERNQRPSITQRQDEKTSMCACRSRVCSTSKPSCFLHRTPIDSICSCSAVQPCCPRIYQEQSQIIRHTITQPVVQGSRSKVSSLTSRFIFPKTRTIVFHDPLSFVFTLAPFPSFQLQFDLDHLQR